MRQGALTWVKLAGGFLTGALSFGLVMASGVFGLGHHSAEHETLKQHLVETKPLAERFLLTEQTVGNIQKTLDQLVLEVRGLRRDLDRREAASPER